jgi:hypothetical protein
MAFSRSVRLGAGILGLGYGVYRLAKGKNDWLTTTAMTAGLSVAMGAMGRRQMTPIDLATVVTSGIPAISRSLMHVADAQAETLANRGWLP